MFFEEKDKAVVVRVRLTPNSSSCLISGVFVDANGLAYLKISVRAAPEKGKANKELISFLAKELKIAKSKINIISGETDRFKKLLIDGGVEIINKLTETARRE